MGPQALVIFIKAAGDSMGERHVAAWESLGKRHVAAWESIPLGDKLGMWTSVERREIRGEN